MKAMSLTEHDGSFNEAGWAIDEEFLHLIRPFVTSLVEAGYDMRHAETILSRQVTWAITMERLRGTAN